MRRMILGATILALSGLAAFSCTIYSTVSLGGLGSDGGTVNNGCRNVLTNLNACGACMEEQAGSAADQLCAQNKYANAISAMEGCAKSRSVDNNDCSDFFPPADASLSNATTPEALTNNIELKIGQKCEEVCQYVFVSYSACGKTVQLAEAGACGSCITEKCRSELVTAKRKGGIASAPLVACGHNAANDCIGPTDCSTVHYKPDAGYSNEMKDVYDCVILRCTDDCPGL